YLYQPVILSGRSVKGIPPVTPYGGEVIRVAVLAMPFAVTPKTDLVVSFIAYVPVCTSAPVARVQVRTPMIPVLGLSVFQSSGSHRLPTCVQFSKLGFGVATFWARATCCEINTVQRKMYNFFMGVNYEGL